MTQINDIDDPRLVKALSHTIRVRVLEILERRTASPKMLAEELGVSLEKLSYHVRVLRELGLIRLEHVESSGSAVQRYYRAVARPRVGATAWRQLPEVSRRALAGAALERVAGLIRAAAEQARFVRPESRVSSLILRLDDQGYADASEVMAQTLRQLAEIERQSLKRLEGSGASEVSTAASLLLFETADLDLDEDEVDDVRPAASA